MSDLEAFRRRAEPDLYGIPGTKDRGLIREIDEDRAEKIGQRKMKDALMWYISAISTIVGLIIVVEKLHNIFK